MRRYAILVPVFADALGCGVLGYGNGDDIGDDEPPAAAGEVAVFGWQL